MEENRSLPACTLGSLLREGDADGSMALLGGVKTNLGDNFYPVTLSYYKKVDLLLVFIYAIPFTGGINYIHAPITKE